MAISHHEFASFPLLKEPLVKNLLLTCVMSLLMVGVVSGSLQPKAPTESQLMSSTLMKSMFGFSAFADGKYRQPMVSAAMATN